MIESIENFRKALGSGYKKIYEKLSKLRVGKYDFQTIISQHLMTNENITPLHLVQKNEDPKLILRVQLEDISGIAANSFGYYVAETLAKTEHHVWSQVLVLPVTELLDVDICVNLKQICTRYLSNDFSQSVINESFFKDTLFIISGCSQLSSKVINNLEQLESKSCNIAVLSDATKNYTCLTTRGYTIHTVGLMGPKGTLKFDNGDNLSIDGLEVFNLAEMARDFSFSTNLKPGSVIDQVSNLVIDMSSGRMVFRGKEHKVLHNIKFVINFDELIKQLHDNVDIICKYSAIVPNSTKDWFTAATTHEADTGVIKTYNIGGRIITRNPTTNYLSYAGKVQDVMDNIIGKIACTLDEEYAKMEVSTTIPQDRWLVIATNKVREELYKNSYIDVRQPKSDKDHPGGVLTTLDTKASDILPEDTMRDPSYRDLDSRLQQYGTLNFSKMLRTILQNRANDTEVIPEELYVLAACFFIAEVGRNPATFLPSLMLLDLAEHVSDSGIWNWASIISQENTLSSDHLYDPLGVIARSYGDFRGMHPMTHDGSYFQSQNICSIPFEERSKLLSLVEYKSLVIMLDWLELSCIIKPMEASWITSYDGEVYPRFMGRLAKTNIIDNEIDIIYAQVGEVNPMEHVWS